MARLQLNDNMDDTFNMDEFHNEGLYHKTKDKRFKSYCFLSVGVTTLNILCIFGGYTFFYYIYLQKYINMVEDNIDGTFLSNSSQIRDILTKFPILINKLCDEIQC